MRVDPTSSKEWEGAEGVCELKRRVEVLQREVMPLIVSLVNIASSPDVRWHGSTSRTML